MSAVIPRIKNESGTPLFLFITKVINNRAWIITKTFKKERSKSSKSKPNSFSLFLVFSSLYLLSFLSLSFWSPLSRSLSLSPFFLSSSISYILCPSLPLSISHAPSYSFPNPNCSSFSFMPSFSFLSVFCSLLC